MDLIWPLDFNLYYAFLNLQKKPMTNTVDYRVQSATSLSHEKIFVFYENIIYSNFRSALKSG